MLLHTLNCRKLHYHRMWLCDLQLLLLFRQAGVFTDDWKNLLRDFFRWSPDFGHSNFWMYLVSISDMKISEKNIAFHTTWTGKTHQKIRKSQKRFQSFCSGKGCGWLNYPWHVLTSWLAKKIESSQYLGVQLNIFFNHNGNYFSVHGAC